MPARLTQEELHALMREQVEAAGGARKWLRLHKLSSFDHVQHMISDGRMATDERVLPVLGFRRVVLFEPIAPLPAAGDAKKY